MGNDALALTEVVVHFRAAGQSKSPLIRMFQLSESQVLQYSSRKFPGLLAVGFGFLATTVSVIGAWIPSAWTDEAATVTASTRSWSGLWTLVHHVDLVHAAYYSVMHLWFDVFGVSVFTLRLFSTIAVGLCCAGVVTLGTMISSNRTAIIAGCVFTVMPRVTWIGIEGRSFAFTAAAAVWLTVLFVVSVHKGGKVRWLCYALVAAISMAIWIYLLLLVLGHGLTALLARVGRRTFVAWLAATALSVAIISELLLAITGQSRQVGWIGNLSLTTVKSIAIDQWFGNDGTNGIRSIPFAAVGWLLVLTAALVVFRTRRQPVPGVLDVGRVCFPWALFPTVVLLGYSVVGMPIYSARYMAFSTPAIALIIGFAIGSFSRGYARSAVLALVVICAIPPYVSARTETAKDGSDWSGVARVFETQSRNGDVVLYGNLFNVHGVTRGTAEAASLAYPKSFSRVRDLGPDAPITAPNSLWVVAQPFQSQGLDFRGVNRIWVVYDHSKKFESPGNVDLRTLADQGYAVRWSLAGSKTDVFLLTMTARR